jgi:hypothetical protein
MEMDSWQFWEIIRARADIGEIGMSCLNCKHKLGSASVKKRAHSGNAYKPCLKCGGEVRFYNKEI